MIDQKNRVQVNCAYAVETNNYVDLPEGKSWDDVQDHYCKWGFLTITWKDGSIWKHYMEVDSADIINSIDWKYPETTVYELGEDDYQTGETL